MTFSLGGRQAGAIDDTLSDLHGLQVGSLLSADVAPAPRAPGSRGVPELRSSSCGAAVLFCMAVVPADISMPTCLVLFAMQASCQGRPRCLKLTCTWHGRQLRPCGRQGPPCRRRHSAWPPWPWLPAQQRCAWQAWPCPWLLGAAGHEATMVQRRVVLSERRQQQGWQVGQQQDGIGMCNFHCRYCPQRHLCASEREQVEAL